MRIIGYERVSDGAAGRERARDRGAAPGDRGVRGAEGGSLIARFTEVESGRNPDRPELKKALHLAKVTGATLVIAKLDRLSRNAAFLLTLRDSGVKFAAVDLPEANDLTVGHHGAGGAAGARGDLQEDQGGAGGGEGAAGSGWATPTAPRRSGGLARAVRRSGRPSRGTPSGMPRTWPRWSRTSAAGV